MVRRNMVRRTERAERAMGNLFWLQRKGGHRGKKNRNKLGVTTRKSNFGILRVPVHQSTPLVHFFSVYVFYKV